ncbi:hypothetical protein CYLTODRAFT_413448 [Cylindrobasidium torrendii FP15055 ss-10]|uniref:Uncharacterized protein n=1 Tax=Cylindrobasidium torrendii FP15055 ss-10 TaxID=1314674 RepID=A0A0D7B1E7_9AGAR|nr:hypothetical protein CYLTODRAFT_413448 [Cylindrobasidium torrendii FP15055 ss-10]
MLLRFEAVFSILTSTGLSTLESRLDLRNPTSCQLRIVGRQREVSDIYERPTMTHDGARKEDRFLGRILSYKESPSWEYHAYNEDNKLVTSAECSPVDAYASLYPGDTFCDGGALVPMKAAMVLGLQDKPTKSHSGSLDLEIHRDPTDTLKQDTLYNEQPMFFVLGDEPDEDGGCALLPLHIGN